MTNTTCKATIYENSDFDLSVSRLTNRTNPTPGNVGICLSGGGSRALTAGMGQLRALNFLKTADGNSLLSQTKCISTVSGGSWLGVTFQFQYRVNNSLFLGDFVSDPGDMNPEMLAELNKDNIAYQVTRNFTLIDIALEALYLHAFFGIPTDMLWQTVIGCHILEPYDLFLPAHKHKRSTQTFAFDEYNIQEILDMTGQCQSLRTENFLSVNDTETMPYLVCNTAMFVSDAGPDDGYSYLAPVQCTPHFTGIVGRPDGVDTNGRSPGCGGVTSFAFNSALFKEDRGSVSVTQNRHWSILDIVGASSAAFADTLVDIFGQWKEDPKKFLADHHNHHNNALQTIKKCADETALEEVRQCMTMLESRHNKQDNLVRDFEEVELRTGLELGKLLDKLGLEKLVPSYYYWPVADAEPDPELKPTRFADGGNLENTGVASILAYGDIDNIIAFINPLHPIKIEKSAKFDDTIFDEQSGVIGTNINIGDTLPSLFGYQPYNCSKSVYEPYGSDSTTNVEAANGVHCQVFENECFVKLLNGLKDASDCLSRPAIYKQTLAVMENKWFGVKAREEIGCIWVYTSPAEEWDTQLTGEIRTLLNSIKDFPNYNTFRTQLTPVEINLLSNFTFWNITNDNNRDLFIDLYN